VDGATAASLARVRPAGVVRPRRGLGARAYLVALALMLLVPAWVFAISATWQVVRIERDAALGTSLDLARTAAAAIDRELAMLQATLTSLAASRAVARGDLQELHEQARALEASLGVHVLLASPDGERLFSTPTPPGAAQPAVPPALLGGTMRGPFAISELFRTLAGRHAIGLAMPVRLGGEQGPRHTLALIADAVHFWSPVLARIGLPAGWRAFVMDGSGVVLAAEPAPDSVVGTSVGPDMLAAIAGSGLAEGARRPGLTRGGEAVYLAWRQLQGLRWTVVIATPAAMIDGGVWRALQPMAAGGGALVLLASLLFLLSATRRIGRPLALLERAADAVARGEMPRPPAPSGLREIDTVGAALAAAAAERSDRVAEGAALAARLEAVLESTTDAVAVLDRQWRLTYLNGRARALFGEERVTLGQRIFDLFPGWAGGPFHQSWLRALREKAPQTCTGHDAGLGRWITAEASPSAEGLTLFLRDVTAEREADAARRLSEMRLRAVLENVPMTVLLAEAPSGRVVLGNRPLLGPDGEVLPYAASMEDYAETCEGYAAEGRRLTSAEFPLARVLTTGRPATAEYRARNRDGSLRWVRASAAPIREPPDSLYPSGKLTGAVVAITDVEAERRAAAALRESELRFRTLAETTPQLVWAATVDGTIVYLNPRYREYTGLAEEAGFPGDGAALHPEERDAVLAAWRASIERGEPFAAQFRLRRADGAWGWFTARASALPEEEGSTLRWIGAATEVTDLIEAREALERQVAAEGAARQAAIAAADALAESEERFRRFAEASPDVLWISDTETGRIEYVSPAFERVWGEPRSALYDDPELWRRLVVPEDHALAEAAALARAEAAGAPVDAEYRIRRRDGAIRCVRDIGFPIRDAAGRVSRIGRLATDVTRRREAEDRQALLMGELNHRVKNTLVTVQSLAHQTARGGAAGAALPEGLGTFLQGFQARLLALSRAHDLLTARTWRGASLAEVAAAALSPWLTEAEARVAISGPRAWLRAGQALGLSLALHELATNAAKHGALSLRGGKVSLAWQRVADDMVELVWQESGGPVVRRPTRRGFGSRLLERGLPGELGHDAAVTLRYEPEGFVAIVRFRPAGEEGEHSVPESGAPG